jgi:hypothetical protein
MADTSADGDCNMAPRPASARPEKWNLRPEEIAYRWLQILPGGKALLFNPYTHIPHRCHGTYRGVSARIADFPSRPNWSNCRKMAAVMGVSKDLIRQVWREGDLKPHRFDRYTGGTQTCIRCSTMTASTLATSPGRRGMVSVAISGPQRKTLYAVTAATVNGAGKVWIDTIPLLATGPKSHGK